MVSKRQFLLAVVFGCVIPFLFPPLADAAAGKVIELKAQTIYAAGDITYVCHVEQLMKALKEQLKDKVHITLFMPGQIVPEDQMFDALKRGVYDIAFIAPSWYQNFIPDGVVGFAMPMGWQGFDMEMEFFYKFGFIKHMRAIHAEQNVQYIGPMPFGSVGVIGNFPFRKLEDLQGKKLWAVGTVAAFIKELGAIPLSFPTSEIYMALKLGTIDGDMTVYSDVATMGYHEVSKYLNVTPLMDNLTGAFLFNLKTWNSLPDEARKVIEDTMVKMGPEMNKCVVNQEQTNIAKCKEAGVEIMTLDPKEVARMRPAAMKVWDSVAARSPRAPKTVQMLKDFLASKGIK